MSLQIRATGINFIQFLLSVFDLSLLNFRPPQALFIAAGEGVAAIAIIELLQLLFDLLEFAQIIGCILAVRTILISARLALLCSRFRLDRLYCAFKCLRVPAILVGAIPLLFAYSCLRT